MSKLKKEIIRYSKKLNITNLSTLRSGNVSARAKVKGVDGFYITPSGRKYDSLKLKDIVFVSMKGTYDKKKGKPSSEWRFHQDIYVTKEAKQLCMLIQLALQQYQPIKKLFQHFTTWLHSGGEDINAVNTQLWN